MTDIKILDDDKLSEYQRYIREIQYYRGFSDESTFQKMNLLMEEVGELAKAIRKSNGEIKLINPNSKFGNIEEELADVFILILDIANKCNVDLSKAFIKKEIENSKRNRV